MDLPYALTANQATQIGLIVLQADESLERDMVRLLSTNAELLVTRVRSGTSVTPESLEAMAAELTDAAGLLPRDTSFAAVGYGCTSGTAQIGAGRVGQLVRDGVQCAQVTEPVTALIAACHHLGVARIGLISPYIASVSDRLRDVLSKAGITVVAFGSFNEAVERKVARIAPASIADAAIAIGQRSDCDAVFLSCTNLRTLDVIDQIEDQIGKPVLSSNQVLAWHLGRLAGLEEPIQGPGRLFG